MPVDVQPDAAPITSCSDITGESGIYTLDSADGPVDVFCEMSEDGGAWTLAASFVNNDGSRGWGTLTIFQDSTSFGSLSSREAADYKSRAYSTVAGNDILVVTDEYAFAFNDVLAGSTIAAFMTSRWPSACSSAWLADGPSYSRGLTPEQAATIAFSLRATDVNENSCFPNEEAAAVVFMSGDLQNNGLGNSPNVLHAWGTLDISLPNLQSFTPAACTGGYPCSPNGFKKPWDTYGATVKAQYALLFVR